ncbi:chemotaxis protein CheB [Sulfobacillus sp. hq2]|uniref:chemotaxis protein CheB n=1 Tax=Sulfobacillus sp. hq2 TaxID=2039167 RepID=UPI000CD2AE55|nr:chemotaxis protein CheB [Sulfobacillus sp. hq2]POB09815.1 chemotaxis response regulator protein-glutamate methylesterase [Sulfobacillus sp. hq2]
MPGVLIVDDSAYARFVLKDRFRRLGWETRAVGDGSAAIEAIAQDAPDLVTLDVIMPGMDGIETVKAIRAIWQGPIIMVSSQTHGGADKTWPALEAGASDFVGKPAPDAPLDEVMDQILAKYEACRAPYPPVAHPSLRERTLNGVQAILIGASTGGPAALARVLTHIEAPIRVPIIIVQHMPSTFTPSLAQRLGKILGHPVYESPLGPEKLPWHSGLVVLARGGYHLRMDSSGVWSEPGARVHGVMPAIDVSGADGVHTFGAGLCMAILTGMGEDGAQSAVSCRQVGGTVLVQDPQTAVVWGMPQAVLNRGAATMMGTLDDIGRWINEVMHNDHGIFRSGMA